MKVLVPATATLDIHSDDELVTYDVNEPVPSEHADADVLVVWQNPEWQLKQFAEQLTSLRMIQTLASGADAVLNAGFDPAVVICSGRSLHDGPVAEHALSLTLATVRRLDRLQRSQIEHVWDTEYAQEQSHPATRLQYTLNRARVTIWGFGSIAARLAPSLTSLGAEVRGVARTAGIRSGYPIIAEEDAIEVVSTTDVLISLAPAAPETVDLFGHGIFSTMPAGSVFVNVGRGATVDENALLAALQSGHLRAAAIDVMKNEPLAPSSPLWTAPNLIITPHVAGNRPDGASKLVKENLQAFGEGRALVNRVQ